MSSSQHALNLQAHVCKESVRQRSSKATFTLSYSSLADITCQWLCSIWRCLLAMAHITAQHFRCGRHWPTCTPVASAGPFTMVKSVITLSVACRAPVLIASFKSLSTVWLLLQSMPAWLEGKIKGTLTIKDLAIGHYSFPAGLRCSSSTHRAHRA